jgi:hypothetical protein|tara:strand:+ start:99 stop:470 length:372 start_codon:yes stop_codon:yes gene_type:complete
MRKIVLKCKKAELILELRETLTADIIYNSLPLKSKIQKWGEEFFFETGLNVELENNAKSVVNIGEIAFWNDGSAIAIGYGKTPISKGNEIRLISPCNIWADCKFDKSYIENIKENETIILERV